MLMHVNQLSAGQLQTFAKAFLAATRKQHLRQRKVQEISSHIDNIRKYARNKHIRKETLQEEIEQLNRKVSEIAKAHTPAELNPEVERQFKERVGQLEGYINQLDQRLLLDEQKKNAQVEMLLGRLDDITNTMVALCHRLKIKPPQHAAIQQNSERDAHGRFLKKHVTMPPVQPKAIVHPSHKQLELKKLKKQLSGLRLQCYNLQRRSPHEAQELKAEIERLSDRIAQYSH